MGGRIEVKSEFGKGTEFIVELPISSADELHAGLHDVNETKTSTVPSFHNHKYAFEVLLIEDDEPTANIIKIYLNEICHTEWTTKGEEAINMARKKEYSIVMVDINLGIGLDGLETIKEIKKINGYHNIPIIAVTAYAMHGDKEKFLKEGCTHYISKPFEKKEIGDLIEGIINEKMLK
jgi:CheY-like chemotaxis protein